MTPLPNEGCLPTSAVVHGRRRLDAVNEHGQQLVERYGRMNSRPRFAAVGHADGKRRR